MTTQFVSCLLEVLVEEMIRISYYQLAWSEQPFSLRDSGVLDFTLVLNELFLDQFLEDFCV